MSQNQLKNYAPKARQDFIRSVSDQAKKVGIAGDDQFVPMEEQGDIVVIGGQPFPRKVAAQRRSLENLIRLHEFEQTMEEIAYTWFNRFAAIRYMELHGYLDHGYRVLSHPDGKSDPEILEHAQHVDLSGLNKDTVVELKLDGTKDEQLYRMLLVAQCNALNTSMPFLFERIDDQTELLLPDNLLHSDSVIRCMVNEIDESDWQEIEIIGWLYQFYISEKKDEVIGKVVKSEDIPAATQLFTPNWIVKYMVQNSLGHQWMATYPNSPLKEEMDYYIEPAEQTEEVQKQLAEITPTALNPEELTLLDPACGSGHILVEAYDLFKAIYEERGYQRRDIPKLILEKNLFGLDIDDRAAQLAGLALLMKARADDRLILSDSVHLNVMAIQSSEGLDAADISKHLLDSDSTSEVKVGTIESLINLFEDAKTFGSLITLPENIRQALPVLGQLLDQPSTGDLLQRQMREYAVEALCPLVAQANMLGQLYDCVVANPPYMSSKSMNGRLGSWVIDHYRNSKSDMFAIFIERNFEFTKKHGSISMITMQSWMFLSSFEMLRKKILSNSISSLLQVGYNTFPELNTKVAQGAAFVILNNNKNLLGKYYNLNDASPSQDKKEVWEEKYRTNDFHKVSASTFALIPGSPITYWIPDKLRNSFVTKDPLKKIGDTRQGMATSDNNRFLRLWFEVPFGKIKFDIEKGSDVSDVIWVPYNKGGETRKWWGNQEWVIYWKDNGSDVIGYAKEKYGSPTRTIKSISEYFKPCISWSKISWLSAFRYFPKGFIFDVAGCSIFVEEKHGLKYLLGFLNSRVAETILNAISPTLNYEAGHVAKLPFEMPSKDVGEKATLLTDSLVEIAVNDWNSREVSWGFQEFGLLSFELGGNNISSSYKKYREHGRRITSTALDLEKQNDNLWCELYEVEELLDSGGAVNNELTLFSNPSYRFSGSKNDEELESLFLYDTIIELISYSIGCMMGRYSLVEDGLIYANNGNNDFDPTRYGDFHADDDGIVPITDTEWFDDDATIRFEEFLKVAWSPETLKENLKFIGESLAKNGGNDPLKTIRNYLSKGFYKDHLKTYKKRPIYWLFSSGKLKAFECLVYLHRYNEGTIARMRVDYVTPLQNKITARIDQLDDDIVSAPSTAARKKLEKEHDKLQKQKAELIEFDDKLRHYADQRISIDLDDGVKVNYGKFGDLLAEVKAVTGKK